jgi:hypothetical protein
MTERARAIASTLLVAALALPRPGIAAPPSEAKPTESAAESTPASEASVREALANGDLTLAREQAIELREAEPTVEHFELEADVHEQSGDYAGAKRALRGALERVAKDDAAKREAITTRLEDLSERSRGAVEDEPTSNHRERLDDERAERLAKLEPPPPKVDPVDVPPPRVPIVKKWYFWLTLTTIVGAAVAITAVAIDANLDDGDAASRGLGHGPTPGPGGFTLRF